MAIFRSKMGHSAFRIHHVKYETDAKGLYENTDKEVIGFLKNNNNFVEVIDKEKLAKAEASKAKAKIK